MGGQGAGTGNADAAVPDGAGIQNVPGPRAEESAAGGTTPELALDGFSGPLERLLLLARAHRIDWRTVSPVALVEQLSAALQAAPARTPLGLKGDWVVMAAWLLQLRSLLLLPAGAPEQQAATAEADQLRGQLAALAEIRALADWLDARPQLGRDAFPRGQPEIFAASDGATEEIDVIEFLWASMALFDDNAGPGTAEETCRPPHFDLYTVADARERILRRLAEAPDGLTLDRLLPPEEGDRPAARAALKRRSAWSSTFVAGLELARLGDVALEQAAAFRPVLVTPPSAAQRPGDDGQEGALHRIALYRT
jgi:segregation and condensation protein A